MAKKKKRTSMTPEERAAYDARTRFLEEILARAEVRREAERLERERRAQRWAWLRRLVRAA
jgi:hypothetical protein